MEGVVFVVAGVVLTVALVGVVVAHQIVAVSEVVGVAVVAIEEAVAVSVDEVHQIEVLKEDAVAVVIVVEAVEEEDVVEVVLDKSLLINFCTIIVVCSAKILTVQNTNELVLHFIQFFVF